VPIIVVAMSVELSSTLCAHSITSFHSSADSITAGNKYIIANNYCSAASK